MTKFFMFNKQMKVKDVYDYIVIGGGIAGLYAALKLSPTASIILLEKDSHYGGRAYNERFSGMDVVTGAGVGRYHKDKLLIKLMKSLGLTIQTFPVKHNYSNKALEHKLNIHELFSILKTEYHNQNQPEISFKKFFIQIFGKRLFNDFKIYNGYTDMLNEDVFQTLYHYGIEDNYKHWTGFRVDWNELVERMVKRVKTNHPNSLKRNQHISSIKQTTLGWQVVSNSTVYYAKNLIMATSIDVIERFFPFYKSFGIEGQPFLRTYIQLDPSSAEILKNYIKGTTVVSNVFQKIIPMNQEKGIYMIAYSDNQKAIKGKSLNKTQIVKEIQKEFGVKDSLTILKLKHYFWDIGTHYYKYKPDANRQHPVDNVYVIGESVSLNQGWVEGALESVEKLF